MPKKYDIEIMRQFAMSKPGGGTCLSKKYVNARTPLLWECGICSHKWWAKPDHIFNSKSWCPKCAGNARLTIKEMQELAASKPGGGQCLSQKYINNNTKLKWKCGTCNHVWMATPDNILRNRWCPICSIGVGERICRIFFEKIFHKEFPTEKLQWLINHDGNLMHLDGYCRDLNLAFEYNGIQHYKYNKFWYKSIEEFKKRRADDKLKKKLCKLHSVTIIIVPYSIYYSEMEMYIKNQCSIKGLTLPKYDTPIDWKSFNVSPPNKLEEMKKMAASKTGGGWCLSKQYLGALIPLQWKCGTCSHIWKAKPNNIKNLNQWCPKCANKKKGKYKRTK